VKKIKWHVFYGPLFVLNTKVSSIQSLQRNCIITRRDKCCIEWKSDWLSAEELHAEQREDEDEEKEQKEQRDDGTHATQQRDDEIA